VTISGGIDPTNHYYSDEAAVAILDLGNVNWGACRQGSPKCKFSPSVTIVDFRDFNNKRDELIAAGVRLLDPPLQLPKNLETSGMGISEDSKFAFISAPEANSIIVVDLKNHQVTKLLPLGYKDMNLPGNGFDASDKDGKINIRNWPVRALYQPKGIWPMGVVMAS